MVIQTVNPTTNKVIESFTEMTDEKVHESVEKASSAFESWKRVADQIDTGMVFINHPIGTEADLPFGGIKRSGYGRELSELGIDEFVNKKLIRISQL